MRAACILLTLTILPAHSVAAGGPEEHFGVAAGYVAPAKPGTDGAVAVTFTQKDPDVRINQDPAPRLKLDPSQAVLVDKQPPPPARVTPFDPATAKYLDTKEPVRFAAALAPAAPKGSHQVKATVVFFYCSKREAWCRRGATEVLVPVTVP